MTDHTDPKTILELHGKWLRGETGGERANLRGANLIGANLRDANLIDADLRGANLIDANLIDANLRGANLIGANLIGANLRDANLIDADLRDADLRGANLIDADLIGANLRDANLRDANLIGANLIGANLPAFQIPQEGELIVWKKLGSGLCKLRIPPEARRTATPVGRKCRAEWAEVIEGEGVSKHDLKTWYIPGETVRPDSYNDDWRIACTHGIHFFLTKEEAEQW